MFEYSYFTRSRSMQSIKPFIKIQQFESSSLP